MNDAEMMLHHVRKAGPVKPRELGRLLGWQLLVDDEDRIGAAIQKLVSEGKMEVNSDWEVVATEEARSEDDG